MISSYLYRNPRVLLLLAAVIAVAGVSSWFVLPQLEDPVLGRRVGIITTAYPGANARQVEALVSIPLEERLQGLKEISRVRSNSQNGISNIVVELQDDVYDVDPVWSVVRDRIADAENALPDEALSPQLDVVPLKAYAAIIALTPVQAADESDEVRQQARDLRRDILALAGTEAVDVFGDNGEEYVIEFSPQQIATLGTSVAAIAAQVERQQQRIPAGRIAGRDGALPLRIDSEGDPIERIEQSVITWGPRGEKSPLADIATVRRQQISPATEAAIIDGRPSLVLGVMVSDSRRVDSWADQLDDMLVGFRTQRADMIDLQLLFSQRDHIRQRMQTLIQNLGIGIAAVSVVVLLLMGWRAMLIVAASLPLSSFCVLAALRALEIPIHQMSVTGLIVALGLLIDNAIVIVEDVRSRMNGGQGAVDAMTAGVNHLRVPLFGSTLTTVLAFLPIATLPGPPGEFVGTIAVSVILAIVASFSLAMTLIPALTGLMSRPDAGNGILARGLSVRWLQRAYEHSLRIIFRVPLLGIVLGAALPVIGFIVARQLPEQFFPASDRLQIQIEVEQSARESLDATSTTVEKLRNFLDDEPAVAAQNWFIGRSAPTFYYNVVPRRRGTPFYAQAFLDLQPGTKISSLVRQLQNDLDSQFPRSRVLVRQLEQGPPFDAPVEVRVTGPDLSELQKAGQQLRSVLSDIPDVLHTRSDLDDTVPQIDFEIDETVAADAGFSPSDIAALLYTSLEGAAAGRVTEGEEEIPLRVRLGLDERRPLEQILALPLAPLSPQMSFVQKPQSSDYNPTTLSGVATRKMNSDVGAIVRIDGRRVNEVKAYITAGTLPATVVDELRRRLAAAEFKLPAGYEMTFGGESEQRSQAVEKLIANGVVLFALMLLTLVLSFGSFRCTFIIASIGGLAVGLGPLDSFRAQLSAWLHGNRWNDGAHRCCD